MRFQPLSLLLGALAPSFMSAQTPVYKVDTAVLPEVFSAEIQPAGDVDEDGRADFTISGMSAPMALTLMSGGKGTVLQTEKSKSERPVILVDLDGDGILEYVGTTSFYSAGTVTVRSKTSTGKVRFTLNPPTTSRSFGLVVTVVGDLDRDGCRDLAISATSDSVLIGSRWIVGVGQVFLHSGKDGKSLGVCAPKDLALEFGADVAHLSDVDGDGVDDIAIASRRRAFIYSGAKATLIRELGSTPSYAFLGAVIANVGDVDGDRVSDVAVTGYYSEGASYNRGVTVYSAKKGNALYRVSAAYEDVFGTSISGGADLDGDDVADFVVGAPQRGRGWTSSMTSPGYLRAFSGKTGKPIFTVTGSQPGEGFGAKVGIVGDVNGDGVADIVTVRESLAGAPYTTPFTQVISGRPLMLKSYCHTMKLTVGGTQALSIDAGKRHAGELYFVLGSLYGDHGFQVDGVKIPLALDGWFVQTLALANSSMFANTFGVLDGNGRGHAGIYLPSMQVPGLTSLSVQHSVVMLRNGKVTGASAATPLTITP